MERLCRYLTGATRDLKFDPIVLILVVHHGTRVFTDANFFFCRTKGSKGVVVRVYIVRHGETQENRDGIIQGQQDTFLNAIGSEQARMVGEALKDAKLGIAFSSDLSRAVKVRTDLIIREKRYQSISFALLSRLFFCDSRGCVVHPSRRLKRYSLIIRGYT